MTNLATEAGWTLEQSYKVAQFQSDLTFKLLHNDMTIRQVIDEVKNNSEFSETDKLFIALVFGAFMARNLGVFE